MSDLFTDLTNERNGLLRELNQARARIVVLEDELDRSDVKRYALADENSNLRRQLAAYQIAQRAVQPLTLTDRGDAADGYHSGEVEP